jgi:hypothetical protein
MSDFRCPINADRVEIKLEQIDSKLDEMKIVQAAQAKDIEHHIARTDLLQEYVINLEKEITPIKDKYRELIGVAKFLGYVGGFLGVVATVLKIVEMLKG